MALVDVLDYLPENHPQRGAVIENLVIQDEDGYPTLTNTCGACGLGGSPYRMGDYEYYISEHQIDNDQKGVAPVILAAIELNR